MQRGILWAWPTLFATAAAAQVYTTDAGITSPAVPSIKERVDWLQRDRGEELRVETTFVCSPTRWLETDSTVPFVHRRALLGAQRLHAEVDGLGDVVLATKWALVRDDAVMASDRLSLFADLSLPTGEHHESEQGIELPRRLQPGLGSLGAALGAGATIVRDRHRAAAALRVWHFGDHDGFDPGLLVTLDTAWWYRLSPDRFDPAIEAAEWRVAVELLSRWQQDDAADGVDLQNGGFAADAALGLQCSITEALRVEVGARAPIVSYADDPAGDERLGLTLSFRLFF